ncbi:MAG: hypothetical protein R3B09_17300 [Nannocystaceae bacterium]
MSTRIMRAPQISADARTRAAPMLATLERRSQAAVHKAGLHLDDPKRYPIAQGSLEARLVEMAERAPAARRQRLAGASARRAAVDFGAPIDFASARPVTDQIGLPLFDWSRLLELVQGATNVTATPSTTLELRLHSVRCVKDSREWGKDEIDLGAVVSVTEDTAGGATKGVYAKDIAPFRVGSFKKGQLIDLHRRPFARLPVESGTFPKVMSATLMMVEKDFSDQKWLLDALRKAKEWAEKELSKLVADKIGKGLLKDALAVAIKIGLDAILKPVLGWVADDPFDPATVTLLLPGADAVGDGGGRTTPALTLDTYIKGGRDPHAHYVVTYDWNLV